MTPQQTCSDCTGGEAPLLNIYGDVIGVRDCGTCNGPLGSLQAHPKKGRRKQKATAERAPLLRSTSPSGRSAKCETPRCIQPTRSAHGRFCERCAIAYELGWNESWKDNRGGSD